MESPYFFWSFVAQLYLITVVCDKNMKTDCSLPPWNHVGLHSAEGGDILFNQSCNNFEKKEYQLLLDTCKRLESPLKVKEKVFFSVYTDITNMSYCLCSESWISYYSEVLNSIFVYFVNLLLHR